MGLGFKKLVDVILLYLVLGSGASLWLVLFWGYFGVFWVFVIIPFRKCYVVTFSERYIHHQERTSPGLRQVRHTNSCLGLFFSVKLNFPQLYPACRTV